MCQDYHINRKFFLLIYFVRILVRLILDHLDENKATGPDDISGRILKECARELTPSITKLCNISLSLGIFPQSWKLANIVPVYKKGDRDLCDNYRPISLLSVISKVLERAVVNNIYNTVLPKLSLLQHGFLRGRSTVTQLLSVFHEVNLNLDSSGQTDIIFLDFSKAFDSVPHNLLLHKLKSFGFHGKLLHWISSYLTNRSQRVVIEGESSAFLPVVSGVPQGSILGPLLFLLYINDISENLSLGSKIALFADDAKIFRHIFDFTDCLALQADLHTLENWSKTWQMNFNAKKCKVISIARNIRHDMSYCLNGTILGKVNHFKDLGIIITSDMTWDHHIRSKVSKANQLLGMIKRSIGPNVPTHPKQLLYSTLIKTTILYASVIWAANRHYQNFIESVQRRATKYILNDYSSDYRSRLLKLKMVPLGYIKEIADACFLYKCLHGYCNININDFVNFYDNSASRTRAANQHLLLIPRNIKTQNFASFYTNRITYQWNSIPNSVRCLIPSNKHIAAFKRNIRDYYVGLTRTKFDVDDACTWTTCCRCPKCRPT